MSSQGSTQSAEEIVWNACEKLHGSLSLSEIFPFVISLFFLKFLSDLAVERRRHPTAIRRSHPFWASLDLPPECDWNTLAAAPTTELVQRAVTALGRVKGLNGGMLNGAFNWPVAEIISVVDRGSLADVIDLLSHLDFRPFLFMGYDLAEPYESLLEKFAESQGSLGEFSVPREISLLMARLLEPAPGDSIYDPFCRSGQLLAHVAKHAQKPSLVAGQTRRLQEAFFASVNMVLSEFRVTSIVIDDSIWSPLRDGKGGLLKFDVVVSNPPFGVGGWGAERAWDDPFDRFNRGVPPDSRADYAFISHAVASLREKKGRSAIVVSLGALFREGREAKIRQNLILDDLIDGVVVLPANLFVATRIAVAIMLLKKRRATRDVLFVDASKEFTSLGRRVALRAEAIDKIPAVFKTRSFIQGFSRSVTPEEIGENDFNLNVSRYIDNLEGGARNFSEVWAEAEMIEGLLSRVREDLKSLLRRLGFLESNEK